MVFIGLASAELSARRVAQRVADGGHDVPADRILKRFPQVMGNLASALRFLDQVIVLDNSAVVDVYREIAVYERGKAMWPGSCAGRARRWMPPRGHLSALRP